MLMEVNVEARETMKKTNYFETFLKTGRVLIKGENYYYFFFFCDESIMQKKQKTMVTPTFLSFNIPEIDSEIILYAHGVGILKCMQDFDFLYYDRCIHDDVTVRSMILL